MNIGICQGTDDLLDIFRGFALRVLDQKRPHCVDRIPHLVTLDEVAQKLDVHVQIFFGQLPQIVAHQNIFLSSNAVDHQARPKPSDNLVDPLQLLRVQFLHLFSEGIDFITLFHRRRVPGKIQQVLQVRVAFELLADSAKQGGLDKTEGFQNGRHFRSGHHHVFPADIVVIDDVEVGARAQVYQDMIRLQALDIGNDLFLVFDIDVRASGNISRSAQKFQVGDPGIQEQRIFSVGVQAAVVEVFAETVFGRTDSQNSVQAGSAEVGIHQNHPLAGQRQRHRHIGTHDAFAHAAFASAYRDYFIFETHSWLFFRLAVNRNPSNSSRLTSFFSDNPSDVPATSGAAS